METTLYYKDGSSDKVYQAQVAEQAGGFIVTFQYGRRGSALQSGVKTLTPVTKDKAVEVFNKLVKSKKAKGYTEGEAGTPFLNSEKTTTGISPQLLSPIEDVEPYLKSSGWAAEEKLDGKRILIQVDKEVVAINRSGLTCGIPKNIADDVQSLNRSLVIDGELIGNVFHVFDLLELDGEDKKTLSYLERKNLLNFVVVETENIKKVANAITEIGKRQAFASLSDGKKEGIVFKKINSPYQAGRFETQVKFKFQEEATLRVASVSQVKRSFAMATEDGAGVGKCAIPANKPIPKVGDLVEVRYLYAYEKGALYQPFFKGIRDDKAVADLHSSLKFKGA